MSARPRVVAFDIVETTFSLDSLRPRLEAQGIPGASLETWFARILRDAFALAATDTYAGFREIAAPNLAEVAREHGRDLGKAGLDAVLDGFGQLDPHPDAAEAFGILRSADVRVAALSNGAAETTQALFQRAGLASAVERVISVAEIRQWKPRRGLYLHAAEVLGVAPAELALVATHAWDVHGAKCAGCSRASSPGARASPPRWRRQTSSGKAWPMSPAASRPCRPSEASTDHLTGAVGVL